MCLKVSGPLHIFSMDLYINILNISYYNIVCGFKGVLNVSPPLKNKTFHPTTYKSNFYLKY